MKIPATAALVLIVAAVSIGAMVVGSACPDIDVPQGCHLVCEEALPGECPDCHVECPVPSPEPL